MTYMVTSLWRGAHHIGNMRGFSDLGGAIKYANTLGIDEFEVRVYQLSETDKPKIVHKCGHVHDRR